MALPTFRLEATAVSVTSCKILVFVVKGTRGDVEPCFRVAARIVALCCGLLGHCLFITHKEVCGWLETLASAYGNAMTVRYLDSPAVSAHPTEMDDLCHQAAYVASVLAQHGPHTSLHVVHNLFAMEAVLLARWFGATATAISPYLVPAAPPKGFDDWLATRFPAFVAQLRHRGCVCSESRLGLAAHRSCGLHHFLFPLLNEHRWDEALRTLGCTDSGCAGAWLLDLQRSCSLGWLDEPLLYGFSPQVAPPRLAGTLPPSAALTGFWRAHDSGPHPPSPCSDLRVASCLSVALAGSAGSVAGAAPLFAAATSQSRPLALLCLGSMPALGIFDDGGDSACTAAEVGDAMGALKGSSKELALLVAFAAAASLTGAVGVVVSSGWSGYSASLKGLLGPGDAVDAGTDRAGCSCVLQISCRCAGSADTVAGCGKTASEPAAFCVRCFQAALQAHIACRGAAVPPSHFASDNPLAVDMARLLSTSLVVLEGSPPFSALMPLASVVVHHGGSGTVSEALHAGVPQVILPLMFDQFTWLDWCVRLGVAVPMCVLVGGGDEPARSKRDSGAGAARHTGDMGTHTLTLDNVLDAADDMLRGWLGSEGSSRIHTPGSPGRAVASVAHPVLVAALSSPVLQAFIGGVQNALQKPQYGAAARTLAQRLASEDGTTVAAQAILAQMSGESTTVPPQPALRLQGPYVSTERLGKLSGRVASADVTNLTVAETAAILGVDCERDSLAGCDAWQLSCISAFHVLSDGVDDSGTGMMLKLSPGIVCSSVEEAAFLWEEVMLQGAYCRGIPEALLEVIAGGHLPLARREVGGIATDAIESSRPSSCAGVAFLETNNADPIIVVDAGANIGLFAWQLLQMRAGTLDHPHLGTDSASPPSGAPAEAHAGHAGPLPAASMAGARHMHLIAVEPVAATCRILVHNLRAWLLAADPDIEVHATWPATGSRGAGGDCAVSELAEAATVAEPVTILRSSRLRLTVHVYRVALSSREAVLATGGKLTLQVYPHLPGNSTAKPLQKLSQKRAMAAAGKAHLYADSCAEVAPACTLAALTAKDAGLVRMSAARASCDGPGASSTGSAATCGSSASPGSATGVPPAPARIDLLKVDVEGCELEVLRGAGPALLRRMHTVLCEAHDVGQRLADLLYVLLHPQQGGGFTLSGIALERAGLVAAKASDSALFATVSAGASGCTHGTGSGVEVPTSTGASRPAVRETATALQPPPDNFMLFATRC